MTHQPSRSRLLVLSGLVLAAAILVFGFAAVTRSGDRHNGPLRTNSTTTLEFGLNPDETASWGVDLPANPTDSDITFVSAELVDPVGLSILGVLMNGANMGGIVNAYGYPPAGVEVFPVEGSMLPARGMIQVIVGVQLPEGKAEGTIAGVRVTYIAAGQTYEILLPYSLRIVPKAE